MTNIREIKRLSGLTSNYPVKKIRAGLLLAVLLGSAAYVVKHAIKSPIADPLLIAILLGIIVRSILGEQEKIQPGISFAPAVFIPVGIIFYGAHNLNFAKLMEVESVMIYILIAVMIVYFTVIIVLGKILGQKKEITYLTASGSAICGASAIAVTSPAVDADPDDISISLLSVTVAAFVGFFIIIPFLSALFNLSCNTHCMLSGSILQFTGLVKIANNYVPYLKSDMTDMDLTSLALSLKAVRYLGLLIVIPLFASLVRKKLYVPWFLWAFLLTGLLGTWIYVTKNAFYTSTVIPLIKPVHDISWSIAMAAIGLNADIKGLLSNNGSKALIMAFTGFLAALLTFYISLYIFTVY